MDVHPLIRHAPDPDHPGWWTWDLPDDDRFHAVVGKLLVREDGSGRAVCRMFPEGRHSNLGDMVHGGALLTFIDMAFFAGGRLAGANVMRAVTLDCSGALPFAGAGSGFRSTPRWSCFGRPKGSLSSPAGWFRRGSWSRPFRGRCARPAAPNDGARRPLSRPGRGRRAQARSGPVGGGRGARPDRRRACGDAPRGPARPVRALRAAAAGLICGAGSGAANRC